MRQKVETKFYGMGGVTVCLARQGDNIARGIAVCSPDDNFTNEEGEQWSFQHAMMAMGNSRQLRPITHWRARRVMIISRCPFVHKGERNPVLTFREVKMLKGVKDPFHFSSKYKVHSSGLTMADVLTPFDDEYIIEIRRDCPEIGPIHTTVETNRRTFHVVARP